MNPDFIRDALIASRSDIRMSDAHVYQVRHPYTGAWNVFTGTTTCIDNHMPKPWVGGWYAKEAAKEATERILALDSLQLKPVLSIIEEAKTAARRKSNRAKSKGTDLHTLPEWWTRAQLGHEEPMPEITDPEVKVAWGALLPWLVANVTPILPEQPVFSRTYRYAGTLDLLAIVKLYEELVVLDFKTDAQTPKLKPEYILQSHAYRGAIREMVGYTPAGLIVVLPKDKPRPAVQFDIPWDEEAYQAFLNLLAAFRWNQGIPKDTSRPIRSTPLEPDGPRQALDKPTPQSADDVGHDGSQFDREVLIHR